MSQGDGRPDWTIATLNTVAVNRFGNGSRRIDRLRRVAYDYGLSNEQARIFGKLTATATWEKLLLAHGLEFEQKLEITSTPKLEKSRSQEEKLSFLEWVDFGQLIAVTLASVGFAVLVLSLWRQINPLNLFPPVKIQIQIGASK